MVLNIFLKTIAVNGDENQHLSVTLEYSLPLDLPRQEEGRNPFQKRVTEQTEPKQIVLAQPIPVTPLEDGEDIISCDSLIPKEWPDQHDVTVPKKG